MMGHLLGAAGAVEAAVCLKAIETGMIPPTINMTDPDLEVPLDFVPNKGRERRITRAMSNSFGFGGTNVTLIFSAFEG
jgi:3-oxoacyl-[acyl-carrier-protein] synthase II